LRTRYGQTSCTSNSVDDNVSPDSVAVDTFIWLPERNASASAHSSGNLQEAKSTGAVSQIEQVVYYAIVLLLPLTYFKCQSSYISTSKFTPQFFLKKGSAATP
jgi:hypothetical protein